MEHCGLPEETMLALALFAKANNMSVPSVINKILIKAVENGALSQPINSAFATPVNLTSIH